ncbi:MAG: molybdenum cofactor guanylyltransferase MobA [Pseudomonadota bacterium]
MTQPAGVILAGGRGARMGGVQKASLQLGGATLLSRTVDRLEPQVARLAVNANAPLQTDLPVLSDPVGGYLGPLAGVLAAIDWASGHDASHVVTVAVDTPFFPGDLVPRLMLAAETHADGLSVAATSDGAHGTFGLWPVALRNDLARYLEDGGRKVTDWTDRHGAAVALFPDTTPPLFFNINRPADLERATRWV